MGVWSRAVDGGFRGLNAIHRSVLRLSRGRVGHRAYGVDMIELVTIGRRSGRPHATMLLVPVRDGDRLIVIASKGGDHRDPDWFKNICADPRVFVRSRRAMFACRAEAASGGERRDLWARALASYPHYEGYQRRADREIPVVVLDPGTSGLAARFVTPE